MELRLRATCTKDKIRRKWAKDTLSKTTQDDLQIIHLPTGHTLTPVHLSLRIVMDTQCC